MKSSIPQKHDIVRLCKDICTYEFRTELKRRPKLIATRESLRTAAGNGLGGTLCSTLPHFTNRPNALRRSATFSSLTSTVAKSCTAESSVDRARVGIRFCLKEPATFRPCP